MKKAGALVFLAVAIILVLATLIPRDYTVPYSSRGCYASADGLSVKIDKNEMLPNRYHNNKVAIQFSKTNNGYQLNTSPSIAVTINDKGKVDFIYSDKGYIVKVFKDSIAFFVSDGRQYSLRKVKC